MIRKQLTVVAALAALGVAGCGGDDSNKALSYGDFSKEANKVCQEENAKIEPVSNKIQGQASSDAAVFDELIPKLEAANDRFAELNPPEELKATFDSFNTTTEQQIEQAKKAQAAAKAGDQDGYIAVIRETQPLAEQSKLEGSKLGAAECAK
jgi:hypothetical protein